MLVNGTSTKPDSIAPKAIHSTELDFLEERFPASLSRAFLLSPRSVGLEASSVRPSVRSHGEAGERALYVPAPSLPRARRGLYRPLPTSVARKGGRDDGGGGTGGGHH